MFRTLRQRGAQNSPVMMPSKKGVLDEDGWKCNCNPRLPAAYPTVKKKGPNQGRKFYTCANRDTGCDFFLWDEEARARENNDSPSKSRTSPRSASRSMLEPPTPITTPRRSPRNRPVPPPSTQSSPIKRRISAVDIVDDDNDDDDDDDDDFAFSGWKEASSRTYGPSTPRKERRTNAHTSPSKSRLPPSTASTPISKGMNTPIRGVRGRFFPTTDTTEKETHGDDIFTTPAMHPGKNNLFKRPQTPPPPADRLRSITPITPKSAPRVFGSPGRGLRDDLIVDVFALLAKNNVNLKGSAGDLRGLLTRHVWQKEGISQGREVARQAIAKKSEEYLKLEEKVKELEGKLEVLEEEKAEAEIVKEAMRKEMSQTSGELERLKLTQKSQTSQMSTETQ